jgi:PAS domain S-box-containing protein
LLNLKATYALLSSLLLALVLGVSGRVLESEYRQAEHARERLNVQQASQRLSEHLPAALLACDRQAIRSVAAHAARLEGILGARITDAAGRVLADHRREGIGEPVAEKLDIRDEDGTALATALLWRDSGLVPARTQRMWRLYLTSAALAVSLMMVLNLWFVGNLSYYLRHLLAAFRRVDAGDLSARLSVRSSAEFRRLQDYFNHMLRSLQESQSALQAYAAEAERRNLQLRQEVEERKRAESAAQQSERKFHAVFDESYETLLLLAEDGTVQAINQTGLRLLARRREETLGQPLWTPAIWGNEEVVATQLREAFARARTQDVHRMELDLPGDAGRPERVLDLRLKAVKSEEGRLEWVICEGYDITERVLAQRRLKESEAQVRQAQKMDAIGRLAGGIAHDFNNLLTSILGFGQIVLEGLDETHPCRKDMLEVISSAERAKDLTMKLLTFSRKKADHTHSLNLNSLLRSAEKLIKVSLHEDIEYVPTYDDSIGLIEIDATSMEQIIVNLAVNARDAMPRSGRLYAETTRVLLDEEFCAKWPAVSPGWYVRVSFRDTGYGMSEEILSRIFEPFFTTKEPGEGTGLGLSTVYGIVQQHKGLITCESRPGEGTEFRIFLPEASRVESGPSNAAPVVEERLRDLPTGVETILLVEDEQKVRDLAVKMIRSLGYRVLTAGDGEEGLQVYTQHQEKIALILSDVVMPLMSGPEMVSKIKMARKDLRYLFVSGFTRDQLEKHLSGDRQAVVIQKPYTRQQLAFGIRAILDGTPMPRLSG